MLNQSLPVKSKSLALLGGTVILILAIVSAAGVGNTPVVREEVTLMRTPTSREVNLCPVAGLKGRTISPWE